MSNGESLWAVRYSTEHKSRTLFLSADADTFKRLYPDNPRAEQMHEGDRLVVSEPFSDLPGIWHEIPESTAVTIHPGGEHETQAFEPVAAARA